MWEPSDSSESEDVVAPRPQPTTGRPGRANNKRPVGIRELRARLSATRAAEEAVKKQAFNAQRARGGRPRSRKVVACSRTKTSAEEPLLSVLRCVGTPLHKSLHGALTRDGIDKPDKDVEDLCNHVLGDVPRVAVGISAEAVMLDTNRQQLTKDIREAAAVVHFGSQSFLASCISHLLFRSPVSCNTPNRI